MSRSLTAALAAPALLVAPLLLATPAHAATSYLSNAHPLPSVATDLATDEFSHLTYAASPEAGIVSVLDVTGRTVGSIIVPDGPQRLEVDETSKRLYVLTEKNTLVVIDTSDSSIDATIDLPGQGFTDLDIDETTSTVYLPNRDGVDVVRGLAFALQVPIADNDWNARSAVDTTTGLTYVTRPESDRVLVLQSGVIAAIHFLPDSTQPTGVAVNSASGAAYVVGTGTDDVTVLKAGRAITRIQLELGSDPSTVTADPGDDAAYISGPFHSRVSYIKGGRLVSTHPGSVPGDTAVDTHTNTAYVMDENQLLIIEPHKITTASAPAAQTAISVDSYAHTAFVADRFSASVTTVRQIGLP